MGPGFSLHLGRDAGTVGAARALRHAVFVGERGAAPGPDGREGDAHDAACDHLILRDRADPARGAVAALRIADGGAYVGRLFDLSLLHATGRPIAEAGRACVHPDYRGGFAASVLLMGLIDILRARGIQIAVGAASFPGAAPDRHMPALRRLRIEALAPEAMRPVVHGPGRVAVAGDAPRAAMAGVPALIKAYLRAGAWVGDGAHVDAAFGTVDVCMVLDLARLRLPAATMRRLGAGADA